MTNAKPHEQPARPMHQPAGVASPEMIVLRLAVLVLGLAGALLAIISMRSSLTDAESATLLSAGFAVSALAYFGFRYFARAVASSRRQFLAPSTARRPAGRAF